MEKEVRFSEPEVKHSEAETASKQPSVPIIRVEIPRCPACGGTETRSKRRLCELQERICTTCGKRFHVRFT